MNSLIFNTGMAIRVASMGRKLRHRNSGVIHVAFLLALLPMGVALYSQSGTAPFRPLPSIDSSLEQALTNNLLKHGSNPTFDDTVLALLSLAQNDTLGKLAMSTAGRFLRFRIQSDTAITLLTRYRDFCRTFSRDSDSLATYRIALRQKLDSSKTAKTGHARIMAQLCYLQNTDSLDPMVPIVTGKLEKQLFDTIVVQPDSLYCGIYLEYFAGSDTSREIKVRKIRDDLKAYHEVILAASKFRIQECEKYCTAVKNAAIPGCFYKQVSKQLENLASQEVFHACDSLPYVNYLRKFPRCSKSIRSRIQARLTEISSLENTIKTDTFEAYQKFMREYATSNCTETIKDRVSTNYWENHPKTDMQVWFSLASACITSFQHKKAETSLKSALQLFPSKPEPAEQLAMLYDRYGSFFLQASPNDSSGKYYAEAIHRGTKNSKVYFVAASCIQGKDRQRALQYLDKSISLDSACKECRSLRKELLAMGQ
jgi:hypothetical protein